MEKNDKNLLCRIAETLQANKVTIQTYDFDDAMDILAKNNYTEADLNLFEVNAFQVYMELMRIETIKNMQNSIYPNIKN